ncbi:hypothetical protein [Sphingomicrobium aestuariivivum]|uniref:hypothetical protein n=1 Tax=Sphingomicrobium aestuariivivum TaxID=1582356 RepID=UPI001FD6C52F|nr:hypothetical protein [Sphingomicrobium aestuariivivum]MCJ8191011.1 hypothetical protein [Sphingomicrobium aestuariivivum]
MKFFILLPALALTGASQPVLEIYPDTHIEVSPREPSPDIPSCALDRLAGEEPVVVEKRDLGDLPPADAYMAVWRTDAEGCADPLTASAYRDR